MKEIDVIKDILQTRISNQVFYNDNLINIKNPELRQVFTQLRDDEMRSIVKLQQKVTRLESPVGIISKIFPGKKKF
ncbi:MAG: hypothetical protein ACM3PP_12215 [Candidatus Saccharibacteria bacterium]